MKRLVFCFDGTWNALNANTPTNVVLTAASIFRQAPDGITQIIHYDEGVGTGRLEKLSGGMFGAGLVSNVREAYRFLIFNYDPGDEIYVFGFSRGAFSARTFVGFLKHVGPLRRLHAARIDEALELYENRLNEEDGAIERLRRFRADYSSGVCIGSDDDAWRCQNVAGYVTGAAPPLSVRYLGVWDTVSALGVPAILPASTFLNRKHAFHDASLCNFVEQGRHAIAIDERRSLFPAMPWGDLTSLNAARGFAVDAPNAPYQEKWFPGTHGSVGGGGDIRGLSDGALAWVIKGARQAGLKLDIDQGSRIQSFAPDPLSPLVNVKKPERSLTSSLTTNRPGPDFSWQVSASAIRRWQAPPAKLPDGKRYRPKTLGKVAHLLDAMPTVTTDPATAGAFTFHVVEAGDALRKLAKRFYGDADQSRLIFDANRDLLDDPDDIFVGQKLRIPAGSDADGTSRALAPLFHLRFRAEARRR